MMFNRIFVFIFAVTFSMSIAFAKEAPPCRLFPSRDACVLSSVEEYITAKALHDELQNAKINFENAASKDAANLESAKTRLRAVEESIFLFSKEIQYKAIEEIRDDLSGELKGFRFTIPSLDGEAFPQFTDRCFKGRPNPPVLVPDLNDNLHYSSVYEKPGRLKADQVIFQTRISQNDNGLAHFIEHKAGRLDLYNSLSVEVEVFRRGSKIYRFDTKRVKFGLSAFYEKCLGHNFKIYGERQKKLPINALSK